MNYNLEVPIKALESDLVCANVQDVMHLVAGGQVVLSHLELQHGKGGGGNRFSISQDKYRPGLILFLFVITSIVSDRAKRGAGTAM